MSCIENLNDTTATWKSEGCLRYSNQVTTPSATSYTCDLCECKKTLNTAGSVIKCITETIPHCVKSTTTSNVEKCDLCRHMDETLTGEDYGVQSDQKACINNMDTNMTPHCKLYLAAVGTAAPVCSVCHDWYFLHTDKKCYRKPSDSTPCSTF